MRKKPIERAFSLLTIGGTLAAAAATAHTAYNLTRVLRPPDEPPPAAERVSVLLPLRNEAHRVEPCLRSLMAQHGVRDLEIVVLDDGSSDGTKNVVRQLAGNDSRVRLIDGKQLPPGWLGKPYACAQLAEAAGGSVLVFLDADVRLEPGAIAATVALLRWSGLDLVSPYPRQLARTPAERLVQPLLQWSWLTTLPLELAQRSSRPSLAAANGQLMAVDAIAYQRSGGHGAVRLEVLDDIALLRAIKRTGGRGSVADGTRLATCRMYSGWPELRDGYTKSLWAAFGPAARSAAVVAALSATYVVPAVAMLRGSRMGLAGYAAGVAGRVMVARRTGSRVFPDAFAHPLSIMIFGYLTALSWWRRRHGTLAWKGRAIT